MILVLTFQFAVFYAFSTLAAVLTRSPVVSILICVLLWATLFGVGWIYRTANWYREVTSEPDQVSQRIIPNWALTSVDIVHAMLPHYMDLDKLAERVLYERLHQPSESEKKKLDKEYEQWNWAETMAVSSLYIFLTIGLASLRFATKDY